MISLGMYQTIHISTWNNRMCECFLYPHLHKIAAHYFPGKTEYIFAVVKEEGRPTVQVRDFLDLSLLEGSGFSFLLIIILYM